MKEIEVVKAWGGSDGYYWDWRMYFRYKGNEYTLIDIGSGSGWIPCVTEISKGFVDLKLESWREQIDPMNAKLDCNKLAIDCVKLLEESGKDSLVVCNETLGINLLKGSASAEGE